MLIRVCSFFASDLSVPFFFSSFFFSSFFFSSQGVTDHWFVFSYWTFCPVFWLFGSIHLRGFCFNSLKKVVVWVSWDDDSSFRTCSPDGTGFRRRNCRISPPNTVKKEWKKFEFRVIFWVFFFSESSIFFKKWPNSTSNLTSNCPVFLQK